MDDSATNEEGRKRRHMLVFDTAYTYRILVERNIAAIVTGRDHGGWFDHVWTVHPVAGLLEPEDSPARFGRPVVHALAERHTFIEGKFGRFAMLRRFEKLNFALAQAGLLWLLARIAFRNRLQIIRAEEVYFCGVMAWLLARIFRVPLLVGVWGNPRNQREQTGRPLTPRLFRTVREEEAVERFVLKRADRVMIQNEDNRNYVLSLGIPRERTALFRVGNAIERRHFTDPAERPDAAADLAEAGAAGSDTLLVVARLQAVKLIDDVIRAMRILKDRGRPAKLLLAGEGVYRDALVALADELGVADRVLFLGNRDQDWLWRVVPRVTMVVSPVTGRALAEVALAGAPIVAYDIDWQSELVETGVTGELVPYPDHEKMADAIDRFLADPDYARRMGAAVRRRALEMMDPEANDRMQVDVYRALMDSRQRR
jgi:glycosyltransferase involved in cell wall biosynthesis